jgi:hypothetical protein
MLLDMLTVFHILNPYHYILRRVLKDHILCNNPLTVKELWREIEDITGSVNVNMMAATGQSFILHLLPVVEDYNTENIFM